jgi:hypothetical protein
MGGYALMKTTLRVLVLLSLTITSLIVATGCAHVPTPSTEVCAASFGILDEADNLTPTNRVPHRVGLYYAWRLTIHSSKSKVRVKEVFKLPASAPWVNEASVPDFMKMISDRRSKSGNIRTEEFDLKMGLKGYQETEIEKPYRVVDGDPQGTHRISLWVEGKLIKQFTFQVVGE